MSHTTLRSTPTWRSIVSAEIRSVAIALRPIATVALSALAVVTLVVGIDLARQDQGLTLFPEMGVLVALLAAFLPIAVWKGEYAFRHSYLAAMPVDRTRHAAAKIAAGWVWLMAAIGVFLAWMFTWAIVTEGHIGLYFGVPRSELPSGATPEEAMALVRTVRTPAWQWTAFFTGATIAYLLGSAVVLSGRRVRRWLAGIVIVVLSIMFVDDEVRHLGGTAELIEAGLITLVEGKYGLEILLEGRKESLLVTSANESVRVLHGPQPGLWLLATFLWLTVASAVVLAVLRRNRVD